MWALTLTRIRLPTRLLSSEQLGSVVAFVIALSLLGSLGYRPLSGSAAPSYLAALALLLAGRRPKQQRTRVGEDDRAVGLRRVGRVLAPLLAVTALTAGTEISLGLLLILHLESAFDLDPQTIALLFFPGESCSWCCPSERSK
jgi:hypothetical protein